MKRHSYHRLSEAEKVAYHLARIRRTEIKRCPECRMGVLANQLDAHLDERCPGVVVVEAWQPRSGRGMGDDR